MSNQAIERFDMSRGVSRYTLQEWKDCRQRAEFMLQGWRTKDEKAALRFGSLIHECIEDIIIGYMAGLKKNTVQSAVIRRLNLWYDEQSNRVDFAAIKDSLLLEKNKAWLIMSHYIKHYWKDDNKRDWIGAEYSFDVNLGGYRLRGRVDGLLMIHGKLWILETKTTGDALDGEHKKDLLSFDFQNLFYALCVEEARGEPVAGILYNLIKKPKHKTIEKARDAYAEKPAKEFFKRIPLVLTKKDKKLFYGQLLDQLKEFSLWAEGKMPTYRNESACRKLWVCQYVKACASQSMAGYEKRDRDKEKADAKKEKTKKRKAPERRRPPLRKVKRKAKAR